MILKGQKSNNNIISGSRIHEFTVHERRDSASSGPPGTRAERSVCPKKARHFLNFFLKKNHQSIPKNIRPKKNKIEFLIFL